MDFSFTTEQKMFRTLARKFVDEQVIPLEKDLNLDGKPRGIISLIGEANFKKIQDTARELGLWAPLVKVEDGGPGLGYIEFCILLEEIHRFRVPFALGYLGHVYAPVRESLPELKKNYLTPVVQGTKWHGTCIAQTEPNAGSDPASIQTKATWDGKSWVINGSKCFIDHAGHADYALVLAVTDKTKGNHGMSMFCVDRSVDGKPGYKVVRLIPTMGDWAITEIEFDDCVVPAENIMGEPGQGFMMAQKGLIEARLHHASRALGVGSRMIDMGVSYAQQRVTFGKPLSDRQAVQFMLTDSVIDMQAIRAMSYQCACQADQGKDIRHEAAITKVFADEAVIRLVDRIVQIHGALGYCRDYPVEAFYRNSRMMTIGGGAVEVMKYQISRAIFNGFRSHLD